MMWKPVIALSMLLVGSAVNAEELIMIDVKEPGYGAQLSAREALPKTGYGTQETQRQHEATTTGYGAGGTLIPNKKEKPIGGYKTTTVLPVVIDVRGGYPENNNKAGADSERRGAIGTGAAKTGYGEKSDPINMNTVLPDNHQKLPQGYPESDLKSGVSLPLPGWLCESLCWRRVPGPMV